MKTKRSPLLSKSYSTLPNQIGVDNSQTNISTKADILKRNIVKAFEKERDEIKNNARIVKELYALSEQFSQLPDLLAGQLRHLKVEPHYREPTSRLLYSSQAYRKPSKSALPATGSEKAGFTCHERIRVIPLHRMLIVMPETQLDTNEKE